MRARFFGASLMLMMTAVVPAEAQQQDTKPQAGEERCQPQQDGQK